MASIKLSSFDYPKISELNLGQEVSITMKGMVESLTANSDGSILGSIQVSGAEFEESSKRENPGELMKKMVRLQGYINTPIG